MEGALCHDHPSDVDVHGRFLIPLFQTLEIRRNCPVRARRIGIAWTTSIRPSHHSRLKDLGLEARPDNPRSGCSSRRSCNPNSPDDSDGEFLFLILSREVRTLGSPSSAPGKAAPPRSRQRSPATSPQARSGASPNTVPPRPLSSGLSRIPARTA